MRWVAWMAELNAPVNGGATERAHLQSLAARGHAGAIAKLEGPRFPAMLGYLWEWAQELAAGRRYGMNGPEPITYVDVDAWARLTESRPFPHEVTALIALDRVLCFPASVKQAE